MFDEKRSWITKYMPFSVFLSMIRYKWKIYKYKLSKLKMVTWPSGLLKYLENLNKFLRVFGVHRRNEPQANVKTFSAKEAIVVIGQVNGFFKTLQFWI